MTIPLTPGSVVVQCSGVIILPVYSCMILEVRSTLNGRYQSGRKEGSTSGTCPWFR